jgi:hypothetical protein
MVWCSAARSPLSAAPRMHCVVAIANSHVSTKMHTMQIMQKPRNQKGPWSLPPCDAAAVGRGAFVGTLATERS